MLEKVLSDAILVIVIIVVFSWAFFNVEFQIQNSEFNSAIQLFQILANFDDGAFRLGDTNYVTITVNRGIIDIHELRTMLEVYIDYNLEYSVELSTKYISYKAGWLVSTLENFYRGDRNMITNSSKIICVFTNQSNGARVFIRPRIRVIVLGTYIGKRIDGSMFKVFMMNILISIMDIGECFGTSPYKLLFKTANITTIVIRKNYDVSISHVISIYAYGESYEVNTSECDSVIITITISKILFEVRGA